MKILVILGCIASLTTGYSLSKGDPVCEMCVETFNSVQTAKTAADVEKVSAGIAKTLCMIAPTILINSCESAVAPLVSENFYILQQLSLTSYWDTEQICEVFGACNMKQGSAPGASMCEVCTDSVSAARAILEEPAYETLVKMALEAVCIPTKFFSPICKKGVDEVVSEMFTLLRSFLDKRDDTEVCESLHMCTKIEALEASMCSVCMESCEAARIMIEEPAYETLVKMALEAVCIPTKFFSPVCKKGVDMAVGKMFSILKEFLDGRSDLDVCQRFHMCSKLAGLW